MFAVYEWDEQAELSSILGNTHPVNKVTHVHFLFTMDRLLTHHCTFIHTRFSGKPCAFSHVTGLVACRMACSTRSTEQWAQGSQGPVGQGGPAGATSVLAVREHHHFHMHSLRLVVTSAFLAAWTDSIERGSQIKQDQHHFILSVHSHEVICQ